MTGGADLASLIAYPAPAEPSPARRAVRAVAASRPAARVLARLLPRVDAGVAGLGDGRGSASGLIAGLPVIRLITTGARTGLPREVRLVPVVTTGVFAVLGTNFGGPRTPAWVHNLLAEPQGTLAFGSRRVEVAARLLDGAERTAVMAAATRLYPGFGRYEARATHRGVQVFALETVHDG